MTAPLLGWLGPWPLLLDALAAHRITRLLTRDVLPPVADTRAALLNRSRRTGGDPRWAQLWTCPWCLGVWIALLVVVGHTLVAGLAGDTGHHWWMLVMAVPAVATVIGLLSAREGR